MCCFHIYAVISSYTLCFSQCDYLSFSLEAMVKNFKVILNLSPQQVVSPGSEVSGTLSFQINEPKSYKCIKVALIGRAHVHWSESYGSGSNRTTTSYTADQEYVNLQSILWSKDQTTDQTLHSGQYNFPFQFSLPNQLPPSCKLKSSGWIRYFVEARIGTGLLKFDHVTKVEFPVMVKVDINIPRLQAPIRGTIQKTICSCCCTSGPITMTAEIPRHGYCTGEVIPVTINVNNRSSREIRTSIVLEQMVRDTFGQGFIRNISTTQGCYIREGYVVLKLVSGPMQPRNLSTWNPGDKLKIPPTIVPSLLSCDMIKVSYILVLSVVIPWAANSSVRIPLTIGNIPLHDPNQSSPSTPPPSGPTLQPGPN